MHRGDSFLFNVIRNNENCITEMLCNLLEHAYLRNIILRKLGIDQSIIDGIRYENIETQLPLGFNARPDISIQNEKCHILIEIKIRTDTPLQKSQWTTYIEKLKGKQTYAHLIFLVPPGYAHPALNRLLAGKVGNVSICTWDELIRELYDHDLQHSNPIVKEYLKHFEEVIIAGNIISVLLPREVAIMYNADDLVTAQGLVHKTLDSVNRSWTEISRGVTKNVTPSTEVNNAIEAGKYLNYKGKQVLFYGLCFAFVAEHKALADHILSFCVHESLVQEEDLSPEKSGYIKYEDWYYKKMSKYILTEEDNVSAMAREVVENINSLLSKKRKVRA